MKSFSQHKDNIVNLDIDLPKPSLISEDIDLPVDILDGFEVVQVDKSPRSMVQIRVSSTDRDTDRDEILRRLKNAGIPAELTNTSSSVDPITGEFEGRKFRINVKPKSGGMGETTLNSSITELFPCIAYEKKLKPKNAEDFMQKLMKVNLSACNCIGSGDLDAAKITVNNAESSSKFGEKMNNALGILKYLNDQNKAKPISSVHWGYRTKPSGVPGNHPGDMFIKYADKSILGVSLKAGGKKTAEPQLNTYHKTVFVNSRGGPSFNDAKGGEDLRSKIYDEVYSKVEGIPPLANFDGGKSGRHKDKQVTINAINKLPSKQQDILYNQYLELVRQGLISRFNKKKSDSMNFIKDAILREAPDVPTVVIKASGTDYSEVTDRNEVGVFLPQVKYITAKTGKTKQDFELHLKSGSETVKLGMTTRSSSGGKLKQFSLKVTYVGIVK
tara:strand:+ start:135 stop:1463 length:1329 start_codon:yes stop_codon:yes gene_type:complete